MAKHCSGGANENLPYLTACGVLDLKRWWEDLRDPGKVTNLHNFKWIFGEHYGNLGCAWRWALDTDDMGTCCFLVFCRCCQSLGLRKNLKSIWEELTGGHSHRSIFFRDWDPVGDRLLSRFALALSIQFGSMRHGLHMIIRNAGGHMHQAAFIESTADLGFDIHEAKWLFTVLDTDRRRFLTEFDRLRFLSHWDPGNQPNMTLTDLRLASHVPKKKMVAKQKADKPGSNAKEVTEVPFNVTSRNPFGFQLELNQEEFDEYQRRVRMRNLAIGKDEQAMAAREKRLAKEEQEDKKMQMVNDLLRRPLIARDFNDADMLVDPALAAHAQA